MSVKKVINFADGGKTGKNNSLRPTVLVVSPAGFTDYLKDALLTENKNNYSDLFQFIFCEHVEDFLMWKNIQVQHDYIVIVMDPQDGSCITMAEDNINKIDSTYINAGRFCFVNGACNSGPTMGSVTMGSINSLSQKYSVMLINGDVLVPDKCLYLASRIIRLASVAIGRASGAPLSVDFSGYF